MQFCIAAGEKLKNVDFLASSSPNYAILDETKGEYGKHRRESGREEVKLLKEKKKV